MKVNYTKTCTQPKDIVSLLKQRGLTISDEQKTVCYLTNIGYFRMSAYLHPLLKSPKKDHIFKENTTFDMAIDMYRFDRKLRILLFNEIEKIEVAIRSAMNNWICDGLNDVFWMTDPKNFKNSEIFTKTIDIIQIEISKTKEEFIIHFQNKYSNPYPPAWMISEIIPFGTLCNIFNNLKRKSLKKKISNSFGLTLPVFSSWILILSNLRNLCGHHIRVWNKQVSIIAINPNRHKYPWIINTNTDMKRIYYRICIIKYLLFTVSPNNTFTNKLKSLFALFPSIDIKSMGFPIDWEKEPLWSQKN